QGRSYSGGTTSPTRRPNNCGPDPEFRFLVAFDLAEIAHRRRQRAAFAALRLAEIGETFGIAAVHAALGHHVVHWDVPGLRRDGVEPGELVGNSYDHGPLGEARERAIEEARAVAEAVALSIPAVHRQNHGVRLDFGRVDRIGNIQRAGG